MIARRKYLLGLMLQRGQITKEGAVFYWIYNPAVISDLLICNISEIVGGNINGENWGIRLWRSENNKYEFLFPEILLWSKILNKVLCRAVGKVKWLLFILFFKGEELSQIVNNMHSSSQHDIKQSFNQFITFVTHNSTQWFLVHNSTLRWTCNVLSL